MRNVSIAACVVAITTALPWTTAAQEHHELEERQGAVASQATDAQAPDAQATNVGQQAIEQLVSDAIAEKKMPGCVIAFGSSQAIEYLQAFGHRQLQPTLEPMTTDTLFDLASLTKPVATATSVVKLLENGKLKADDKLSQFLPEFGTNGKEAITIEHLLLHQSGLIADNPLADYEHGPQVAWDRICELQLIHPVGESFVYSDVNFIVLGKLVEQLSGQELNQFSQLNIFQPLGMQETSFRPESQLFARAATTQQRDGRWLRGEVHDPRAHLLGGIAGHAGLFSTASDLSLYARMMLGGGRLRGNGDSESEILNPATIELMTQPYQVSSGLRGLGWDKQTGFSSNRGTRLSQSAFGHGGFTGTVLWIDPGCDLFFVFLSNRVHPDGTGGVNQLAGKILDVIVDHRDELSR